MSDKPMFKREPYPGTAHYASCYDLARRRSLVVTAEAGSIDLGCRMPGALDVTLELSVADARALAAELIAAADAGDRAWSTNSGDLAVRTALHIARNGANECRLHKSASNEFSRGMCMGQIIVAGNYLGADRLLVMAAKNEIRFLYHYTEGRA